MSEVTWYLFFFNDTATTKISTLPLHDALPISRPEAAAPPPRLEQPEELVDGSSPGRVVPLEDLVDEDPEALVQRRLLRDPDRKSTRLNSSHANISYAVFCLKKKNSHNTIVYLD